MYIIISVYIYIINSFAYNYVVIIHEGFMMATNK